MKKTTGSRRQTAEDASGAIAHLLPSLARRLPSLVGSFLFHTLIFLLILLWFSFPSSSDRGAPGERNAVGSIIVQRSGGGQLAEEEATDERQQTTESAMIELEQLTANLTVLPLTPILAPGTVQNVASPNVASSTDMTTAFQQSDSGIGIGVGPGTGETTVEVFGTGGKGTKFIYVFDRSTSMEGTPIHAAKAELIRSLDSLGDHHQFNIIFYSSQNSMRMWHPPEGARRKWVFATAQNKQGAIRFVNGITADGGTRHYEPLLEAIAHRPDVIFFLTDGDSRDDLTAIQLREIERRNSQYGHGAQINVIQFGGGGLMDSESRSLKQLAAQNFAGQYRYVNVSMLR